LSRLHCGTSRTYRCCVFSAQKLRPGRDCLCPLEGRKTCLHLAGRIPPVSLEISYCELQHVTHTYSLFLLRLGTLVLLSRHIHSISYVQAVYCFVVRKLSSNQLKQPCSIYALVQIQFFLTPNEIPSLKITFIHYSTLSNTDLLSTVPHFILGKTTTFENYVDLRKFRSGLNSRKIYFWNHSSSGLLSRNIRH